MNKVMSWVCCLILISLGIPAVCQSEGYSESSSNEFISPVDHTIRLAGSFGELRSNHFHAGIDIKSSNGTVGDTIRASADGFISRIKIQRGGYGQVLYVDHPNGLTSVYAHLESFADTLASYVQAKQNEHKSYEIDVYPEPHRFNFTQGSPIGIMGNTGRSYGPHLHFEIRNTKTEVPLNPYLHGIGPDDSKAPLIFAVEAHGLNSDHQKIWSQSQYVSATANNTYVPAVTFEIPAWRTGLAIQTFDLMDGANNKNGIYDLKMYVEDSLFFHHKMDSVGFDVSTYINSHIDYTEKKKNNRSLIKCYVSPGNKLSFYPVAVNRGEVKLYKDTPQKVDFVVTDFKGNTSTYTCYVKRREAKEGELKSTTFQKQLDYNLASSVTLGSCRFFFPANSFDKKTFLTYREQRENNSFKFTLNSEYDPLFSYPGVSVPVSDIDSAYHQKLILVHQDKTSYGGHVEKDSLRARIGQFGNYKIVLDTIPPTIEVGNFTQNARGKNAFRFAIYDNYETKGYAEDLRYDVFIDGQWVIASYKELGNILMVPLSQLASGKHVLKIRVEDHSKNVQTWVRSFVY